MNAYYISTCKMHLQALTHLFLSTSYILDAIIIHVSLTQFSSVQSLSHVWLCNPMDYSTPGFPVHHQLLDLAQNQWCHPTTSSFVISFSSCPQSFPASRSFPRSQFFASCGQSIASSTSASVLPMNIQDWFPLGLTCLISLLSKRFSRVFSKHHNLKSSILQHSAFFMVQLSRLFSLLEKPPGASLLAQLVKNLPAMWETWVQSQGWEDPLGKEKATNSSILAWRIPWTVQSMGSQRVGHDWVTYTLTRNTIALIIRAFVSKMMSLLLLKTPQSSHRFNHCVWCLHPPSHPCLRLSFAFDVYCSKIWIHSAYSWKAVVHSNLMSLWIHRPFSFLSCLQVASTFLS